MDSIRVKRERYAYARSHTPRHIAGKPPDSGNGVSANTVRIIACVLLVAAAFILEIIGEPGSEAREAAASAIDKSVDLREAFSSLGEAITSPDGIAEKIDDSVEQVFGFPLFSREADENKSIPDGDAEQDGGDASGNSAGSPGESPLPAVILSGVVDYAELNLIELLPEEMDDDTDPGPFVLPPPDKASMNKVNLGFQTSVPVDGEVTSQFGYRDHPIDGVFKFHYGVDVAADKGTAIGAFADGTVEATGYSDSYGNYVILAHDQGFKTLYAHMDKVTAREGSAVKAGGRLGTVGETGKATGPHLHIELRKDGILFDANHYMSLPLR